MTSSLELICAAIVAGYVLARARTEAHLGRFLLLFLLLVVAAWVAEDSVIHAYGFYAYAPSWSAFLHHVPLLIVCIWPVVVHSAYALAKDLMGPSHQASGLTGFIVLADAALIEPIAVHTGLWSWTAPGPFAVPPVGMLGWSFFAIAVVAVLDWAATRKGQARRWPVFVLVGPGITHVALLLTWWGLLRWMPPFTTQWTWVVSAWVVSAAVTTSLLRTRRGAQVHPANLWLRAPGALFFFVLLFLHPPGGMLLGWTLAFVPPYAAIAWGLWSGSAQRSRAVPN